MNKNVYILLLAIIACDSYAFSLHKKIKSLWQQRLLEKIDQKEIPADAIRSVSVNNHHGSINIKAGPKRSFFVRAIKRAKKKEIDNLAVVIENNPNQITITSHDNNKKKNSYIDYELIVPASCNVTLNMSGSGDVLIKNIHGVLDIVACGDIATINTKKLVSAQTRNKGSITITNATGPIEAYTHKGKIIGQNIGDNFCANSISGSITVAYKKAPSTSNIDLRTTSGSIKLAIPAETNATLHGHTMHGTLMCDHEVTLTSYTTKLNKTAWTQFTRGVDGMLGAGADTSIALNSGTGNVKVVNIDKLNIS